MSSLQYSSVQPDNNRSTYSELDVVNFTINNQGRSLVLGSIRLEGKLRVNTTGNTRATNQDIRFNKNVGIGAYVDSCSVTTAQAGNLENINFDYPRILNMISVASKDSNDNMSSHDVCELKAPHELMMKEYCYGEVSKSSTPTTRDIDFSHKLKCCLNRQVQGDNLPFSKSGFIKLSIGLARNRAVFFGSYRNTATDNMTSVNYVLSDLTISYQTIPDTGNSEPIVMRSIVPIKSTLESDFSNVASSVPARCDAVSISYQEQIRENQVVDANGTAQIWDNSALNKIPNWRSIQYIFNNSNSEYVSYIIDSEQEAVKRGIESLKETGHNQVSLNALDTNQYLLHGLSFGEMIDLSNQKFNIQIDAPGGINANNKMVIYAYFHSLVNV
jgi:hypothetical protein